MPLVNVFFWLMLLLAALAAALLTLEHIRAEKEAQSTLRRIEFRQTPRRIARRPVGQVRPQPTRCHFQTVAAVPKQDATTHLSWDFVCSMNRSQTADWEACDAAQKKVV